MLASGFKSAGLMARRGLAASAQARMASTLVLAEHAEGAIADSTLSVVSAAKAIGGDVTVLVAGADAAKIAEQAAKIDGVSSVLAAGDAAYDHGIAENITALLQSVQDSKSFSHILFAASNDGKNIMPRLGAKLDVQPVSDILEVLGEDTFKRPMYAGNAIATVKSSDSVKLASVRITNFDKAAAEGGSASVEEVSGPGDAGKTTWVADEVAKSDRPELTTADKIVSGGRGLKNGENFEMLYTLADKLGGGAVGASRAAVDAGYVPNELQIGQTGKIVAPGLYIAVGISGAIQHLAGMKDAKTIVCINKDPEAPIFQVSDIGLEADLFKAVPEMIEKL
ncbi:Electron transfer flavoprotein subunit alpha, mitochondrial [Hondaea fermentalgiana]|uniref:Electron transfer flavoprotein subunit alpha n=1 Tax=Hondaea fermentalgiana TaxID=2315210 RepID=A0A2R5GJ96_9STRA|nr:Electron transfer flavoprotein subunit alpha, mitochondrial [Hondaea fermentalgiana]|eukprot:GBG30966.1 Electron transfer flavoprotein subunit alpha, mitochondrial [Hondaea fermentalgiana]